MATTSLWHIEGRLKDLIAYVENPEKTIANNPSLQPLWEVMSYIELPEGPPRDNCKADTRKGVSVEYIPKPLSA